MSRDPNAALRAKLLALRDDMERAIAELPPPPDDEKPPRRRPVRKARLPEREPTAEELALADKAAERM